MVLALKSGWLLRGVHPVPSVVQRLQIQKVIEPKAMHTQLETQNQAVQTQLETQYQATHTQLETQYHATQTQLETQYQATQTHVIKSQAQEHGHQSQQFCCQLEQEL